MSVLLRSTRMAENGKISMEEKENEEKRQAMEKAMGTGIVWSNGYGTGCGVCGRTGRSDECSGCSGRCEYGVAGGSGK